MRFVEAEHPSYKWWALSCTSMGMLLATINSGTLIIALPDLERSLHTSLLQLVWVILAYMIASTVLVLTAGRLSDLFGRKHAYIGGFAVFTAASLGAGFSASGTQLVLCELAKPDRVRGLDVLGTATFVTGLTGLVLGISRGGISGWNDPIVIGGLILAAVLLPAFVAIERRARAPMLDLTIFRDRLFAAATGAAFINGLSRFALLFLFVFFFQGAQGDDPITAGVKLSPMAIGMLVSSPLAGIWADRRGSRTLAALGMLVGAAGLALMTTLEPHSPYWQSTLWLFIVGVGSGMFNSPHTAAVMSPG